jgi:DNA polymerase-3 subunit delta'
VKVIYPWHQGVAERLDRLRQADQLPSAIALTCAPGWGHEALLKHVAMALLEEKISRKVEEFAHPDFRWIVPDGAEIKVDQIRRLNEFAVQTCQAAPRKVAAILDAHLLNSNAANALLKTLEEPPPNTHLLLATPFWGKLIPTVRSRCQRFQVAPDAALARSWLQAQSLQLSEADFAEFGYAPLAVPLPSEQASVDMTAWLTGLQMSSLSNAVDAVLKTDLVAWLGRWYRRLLLHLGPAPIPDCSIGAREMSDFASELLSIRRQIESTNSANSRLLLERLIVRWLQLQRRRPA